MWRLWLHFMPSLPGPNLRNLWAPRGPESFRPTAHDFGGPRITLVSQVGELPPFAAADFPAEQPDETWRFDLINSGRRRPAMVRVQVVIKGQ